MAEVSIIIPVFNQCDFLKDTLKSVKEQSFKNYECIIIDDGSTDNTAQVAKEYCDGNRIKYFYQENKGLAGARNTGIKLARGKYINFIDADDLMYEDFLKNMVNKLENEIDVDVLSCAWDVIDENGKKIIPRVGPVKSNNYFRDLVLKNLFPVHAVILKRNIFNKIGVFNEGLAALEDWDMWLRIAIKGYKFGTIDNIGVSYRRHKKCMTLDLKRMTENLKLFLDIFFNSFPDYMKYKQYTNILYRLKIYLYSEELKDFFNQNKISKEIISFLNSADYEHFYFKKIYEEIRNIKNKKIKLKILKAIYNKSTREYKRYWWSKIIKIKIKNFLGLQIFIGVKII